MCVQCCELFPWYLSILHSSKQHGIPAPLHSHCWCCPGVSHSSTHVVASCEVFICISLIVNIYSSVCRFNVISIKVPIQFKRKKKENLKIHTGTQRLKMLNNKRTAIGVAIPDFKWYYRVVVNDQHGTCIKKKHTKQWNRTEAPYVNPQSYRHLMADKEANSTHREESSLPRPHS